MRHLLPAISVLVLTAPAFGQVVDDQGAMALSQDLSPYLGQEAFSKGVVRVSVEGDAYRVDLNFRPLVGLLPLQDIVTFDLEPYAVLIRPRDDGSWDVSADGTLNGSFEMNGPDGRQSMQWASTGLEWTGIYDPELAAFTNASGSQASMTMSSRDPKQEARARMGPMTFELSGSGTARGGVDFTFAQQISDFAETIKFDLPDVGQEFSIAFAAPALAVEGSGTGMRTRALLDLLAFGVANSDKEKLVVNQTELKSLLLAALPLWEKSNGAYRLHDLMVESPVGAFSAAELGIQVGMNGIRKNGAIEYKFAVSDLNIPKHLLPAWSTPLLPTQAALTVGGVDLNFEDMARTAIEAFDLSQNPPVPAHVGEQIAADFMADQPKFVISRSTVSNDETEVVFEGEMIFVGFKPKANLTIEIAGYDGIIETLKTASQTDHEAGQYVAAALMAKGIGETMPDGRIRWVVSQKVDGSVLVNGTMLKPPD